MEKIEDKFMYGVYLQPYNPAYGPTGGNFCLGKFLNKEDAQNLANAILQGAEKAASKSTFYIDVEAHEHLCVNFPEEGLKQ